MNNIIRFDEKAAKVKIDDPNEHIQRCWSNGNFYEAQRNGLLGWVYQNINRRRTAIDVGASIGNHTLFMAKIMQFKAVVSIEPSEKSFKLLNDNVALNGLKNVITFNYAVGDRDGDVSMESVSDNNIGMNQVDESGSGVRLCTLDSLKVDPSTIDYIKIDVEHYNKQVLIGGEYTLINADAIVSIECESAIELRDTNEIMRSFGYTKIDDLKLNHTPTYIWKKSQ